MTDPEIVMHTEHTRMSLTDLSLRLGIFNLGLVSGGEPGASEVTQADLDALRSEILGPDVPAALNTLREIADTLAAGSDAATALAAALATEVQDRTSADLALQQAIDNVQGGSGLWSEISRVVTPAGQTSTVEFPGIGGFSLYRLTWFNVDTFSTGGLGNRLLQARINDDASEVYHHGGWAQSKSPSVNTSNQTASAGSGTAAATEWVIGRYTQRAISGTGTDSHGEAVFRSSPNDLRQTFRSSFIECTPNLSLTHGGFMGAREASGPITKLTVLAAANNNFNAGSTFVLEGLT